jgi:ribonuclease T
VLARAVQAAGLTWDESSAHSAAYDAEITADVFCDIVNRFRPIYESIDGVMWNGEQSDAAP